VGLVRNAIFANTCYSKALLQCLAQLDELRSYFCVGAGSGTGRGGIGFVYRALQIAFCRRSPLATHCAFALRTFLPVTWQSLAPQDPGEFLVLLLARIDSDLQQQGLTENGQTIIDRLFSGIAQTTLKTASHTEYGLPPDLIYMFPLPLVAERNGVVTVDSCLASLSGTTTFIAGPKVLVFQLMRFDNQNQRIGTPVSFRADLSLPLSDGTTCPYSLRALVGHHGGTTADGHHIAHVRVGNRDPPVWYSCNDATIQTETPQYAENKEVHLLFYDRLPRPE
jgi:hypothetical protein